MFDHGAETRGIKTPDSACLVVLDTGVYAFLHVANVSYAKQSAASLPR